MDRFATMKAKAANAANDMANETTRTNVNERDKNH
jgi:hypothetical protein